MIEGGEGSDTRRAIIVVGMHRSGTSALARVLSLAGCDLPQHVMPPQEGSNELGFWEPATVVEAHDKYLARIGSSWDDVLPLPEGVFTSEAAIELRQQLSRLLREEYGESSRFVVKDPRISRLLPLWLEVLDDLRVTPAIAIAVRNPLEVAASLQARDGFSTTKSLLIWLRHTLESERDSRGCARSIVMYDELLRDWHGVLSRLGADVGIEWPALPEGAAREIEGFLSPEHRHQVADWNMLEARPDVVSWVKEAYLALRTDDPTPVLDQIGVELGHADTALGPLLLDSQRALRTSEELLRAAIAARDGLSSELHTQRVALEARTVEVQELRAAVQRLQAAVHELETRLVERVLRRLRRLSVSQFRLRLIPPIPQNRWLRGANVRPRPSDGYQPPGELTAELRAILEREFDRDHYLTLYTDVRDAGVDPVEHYVRSGWREGRDPSTEFSTSYYLSANPDVAAAQMNPFAHYILTGRSEGRLPRPLGGLRRETLENLRSVDEEISHWREYYPPPSATPMDATSLAGLLGARIGARRHVVISCSQDDYTEVVGGVQLCMKLEQAAFAERDCVYLNLHPAQRLPFLSDVTEAGALTLAVVCDGEPLGAASADAVLAALTQLGSEGVDFGLVIHALHGHSPEVMADLYERVKPQWAWLWLHDFFVVCPSTTLLRNRIEACHAPPPESAGCTICVYGEERPRHLRRVHELLDRVPFKLVAPSQFMADRWSEYFGNPQLEVTVHAHGAETPTATHPDERDRVREVLDGPVRVAFLGAPGVHKGWGVFRDLVRRYAPSGDYRFYHFGEWETREPHVEQRRVSVVESGSLAMMDALRADSIEVALVWSIVEESFGFTTREAFAAGAAVITNEGSGNVARVVKASGKGLVFGSEEELFDAFESRSILEFARSRRSAHQLDRSHFAHSHVTADIAHFDE